MRQFSRVCIGDVTNASELEERLCKKGIKVNILEDCAGISLYAKYKAEKPDLDLEDWKVLAAVKKGQ